jgi:spore coat polysaccharide biosynthesis protein SpsF
LEKPDRPRIALVMQARMGSSRLPGKSLMDLAGAPLVGRIIERVTRCLEVDAIVLATTHKPEDDPLARLGERYGVDVYRGSEHDLVDRYYQAALTQGAGVIVRVPADNPAADPAVIDETIRHHLASGNDFTSTYPDVFDNGYPDGIGAEVFNLDALARVRETATDPRNREHPHTSFYERRDEFQVGTMACPPGYERPEIKLDVNTPEEFRFVAQLYNDLYPENPDFTTRDIIKWYDGRLCDSAGRKGKG